MSYGSGSGDGYGDNPDYLQAVLDAAVGGRASQLRESGAVLAFWRSAQDGRPCNRGGGPPRHVGMVEQENGRTPCQPGMLHATMAPWKWKGERLWVVALWEAVESPEGWIPDGRCCSICSPESCEDRTFPLGPLARGDSLAPLATTQANEGPKTGHTKCEDPS